MKKLFFIGIILLFFFSNKLNAQLYNVALIPDSLKENADAVVRLDETNVKVKNTHKATINRRKVITILNENADALAYFNESYDDFSKLSDISGVLYDANGFKLKTVKKKDIADVSISDGFSIATDARAKRFSFFHKTYPYTVEYEFEEELNGIYCFTPWAPVFSEKMAIQKSTYSFSFPSDYKFRSKQSNVSSPVITAENYLWQLTNYKAIEDEVFSPDFFKILPIVLIAPEMIDYADYKGAFTSWQEYGNFNKTLNAGRDILPESLKQKIHELTDKLPNTESKVFELYNFLQSNTRYISIQLGIGGLQPLDAKFVAEKKYGDCKALSNFMVSLLKEAGIKAYYATIRSGSGEENNFFDDFPFHYSNHIITCVPNIKDTIWLECTSQTVSPGYMGSFTGNRKALLITDDGGVLVNTPKYTSKENVQKRKVDATVNAEGNLTANVKTFFTGMLQEEVHGLTHDAKEEIRKKYLNTVISLPTYSVEKFNYKEIRNKIPAMEEELIINSPNYASITGKRLFIVPNLFNRDAKLSNDKPRKFDIDYKRAFTEIDTINIKIPDGYTVEAMPKNISISNKFGNYNIQYAFTNNTISLIRFSERNRGYYPKTDYEALVNFYNEKYKADRGKIVLVKKE